MSGRHKFAELEANMSPARRERIGRLAEKLKAQIELKNANVTVTQRKKRSTSALRQSAPRKKEGESAD
jgi:hypothetical protein